MKSLKSVVLTFACISALAAIGATFSASSETSAPLRDFEFTYLTRIPTLPADAKTSRIWIPLPQSDRYQTIGNLKIETPFAYTRHRDPENGNEYLYLQVPAAKVSEPAEVRVSFEVTRHEHQVALQEHRVSPQSGLTSTNFQHFLQPDRRVPLQGVIAELSAQQTRGIQEPLAKAHDDNRVQFTVGRDIRLDPPQQGDPLNYFIYPYAELDGKPFAVESKFSFQDRTSSSD